MCSREPGRSGPKTTQGYRVEDDEYVQVGVGESWSLSLNDWLDFSTSMPFLSPSKRDKIAVPVGKKGRDRHNRVAGWKKRDKIALPRGAEGTEHVLLSTNLD